MNDTLELFKKQHTENYEKAVLENIRNNTSVLFDEDIFSLLTKPPLDSMDVIKIKFLDIAKKNKLILNTNELDKILENYRNDIIKCCATLKEIRINKLSEMINIKKLDRVTDVFKINKKDFNELNKIIKKEIKEQLRLSSDKEIYKNIDKVFITEIDENIKKKFISEILKFLSGSYQRQLLENIDFKILVKDTTLANGIKEHGERYLFTLNNSRIFKQEE